MSKDFHARKCSAMLDEFMQFNSSAYSEAIDCLIENEDFLFSSTHAVDLEDAASLMDHEHALKILSAWKNPSYGGDGHNYEFEAIDEVMEDITKKLIRYWVSNGDSDAISIMIGQWSDIISLKNLENEFKRIHQKHFGS